MVRAPCCAKEGVRRGPWSEEEDRLLVSHIAKHGHANWRALPKQAGLLRCGKSCRLRWLNYLRPDVKRGNFSPEEEATIVRLHESLGNRWSVIAAQLPGRTDNEIKNVWHTHLKKKKKNQQQQLIQETSNYVETPEYYGQPEYSSESAARATESSSAGSSSWSYGNEAELGAFASENYWSEATPAVETATNSEGLVVDSEGTNEEMEFWLKVFLDAGGSQESLISL